MSAPRQPSPLAVGLEIPCPILESLRDTSSKVTPMDPIHEDSAEPEDDPCLPCLQAHASAVEKEANTASSEQSKAISEYVSKMREAIQKQGERLQHEEVQKAQTEESKEETPSEKLDFHIKVMGTKKKRTSLFLGAKVQGKDLLSSIKSKRVSFILPAKSASRTEVSGKEPHASKRISMPLLTNKGKERTSTIKSQGKGVSVLFPPVRSKLTKVPKQKEPRPKIKSRDSPAAPASPVRSRSEKKDQPSPISNPFIQDDEEEVDESEEIALLSAKTSPSSSTHSFDASHLYTPMVSRHEYEYRLQKSRLRKTVDLSRQAVSRATGSVRYHAGSVLSMRRRRKRNGWSKIE